MTATSQRFVTPRDIARILFRQWRKIALVFFSIVTLTLLVIALYPRAFRSEAKLMIRVGRETIGLDPTATTGETIMLQKTQDDEVNSSVNILTSYEVLQGVIERVGVKRIMEPVEPGDQAASDSAATKASSMSSKLMAAVSRWLIALRLSDPGTENDRALRRLDQHMSVLAPKKSMVITVSYTASSAQVAHDIVEAIVEEFLEQHSRLSQSEGSLDFFADQVDKLHKDLLTAQAELRDRKNAYQLTTSGNRPSIMEKANDAMRQKIYDLAVQESELRSRYTDAYPPLREIQRQREQAQRLLTALPNAAAVAGTVDESGSVASGEVEAVQQQRKLDTELQTLNDQEFELAQLEREVNLLEGKYSMHVQKLEQARVNDALGRERITNVKVAQPATLLQKPISPKKMVVLGLGLMLAVAGGFGLAFLSESMDQTLRTTDQVEMELGLPVLASLPYRKRRRKHRVAVTNTKSAGVLSSSTEPAHAGGGHDRGYLGLVTALRPSGDSGHRLVKTIGVVGCDTSTINSRVAGDLAIQAASCGDEPVLLIDADARRRRVSKRFHLNGAPGWRDVVAGSAAADSCIQWSQPGSLAVMGPGGGSREARDADSMAIGVVQLGGIKSDYGLVVIDLPPARELNGRAAVAGWVDEIVLVVEAERTRVQAARRARDLLNRAGVHVTGVVLANRREYIPRWLYQRL